MASTKALLALAIIHQGEIYPKHIIKYINNKSNMIFLLGNHEYEFLKYYSKVMSEVEDGFDSDEVLTKLNNYFLVKIFLKKKFYFLGKI